MTEAITPWRRPRAWLRRALADPSLDARLVELEAGIRRVEDEAAHDRSSAAVEADAVQSEIRALRNEVLALTHRLNRRQG